MQVFTLLDLPTDVLGIICTACDVPTKMVRRLPALHRKRTCLHVKTTFDVHSAHVALIMQSLGAVCKRLHGVLAAPGDNQKLWGDITIRIGGPRRSSWPTTKDLDVMIPWLVQRATGALHLAALAMLAHVASVAVLQHRR